MYLTYPETQTTPKVNFNLHLLVLSLANIMLQKDQTYFDN